MIVDIRQATEGMVLRTPVKDLMGRVLLPTGEKLTARHIEKLGNWGILTLDVADPEAAAADPAVERLNEVVDQEFAGRLRARLDAVFLGAIHDPLLMDLRALAEEHLMRNADLWNLVNPGGEP